MRYHVLIVRRLLRWDSSPKDGGRYEMGQACSRCGAGTVRSDPLFVAAGACKAGVAATYKLQVIVSRDVFERLSGAGVTCLRQVAEKKKKEPVAFWSIEPESVLPRWSDESVGFEVERQCPQCHRDGYFDVPKKALALVYEAIPGGDVFATWEHFGNSRLKTPFEDSNFAVPRLIVSDRVRDVLSDFQGVEFFEVKTKQPNQPLQTTRAFGPRV